MVQPVDTLLDDLAWPEGPTPLADGSIAFVESDRGRVSVWSADRGRGTFAVTHGRPNGTVLGPDGLLYVAQSGPAPPGAAFADALPGIQRVDRDGSVQTIATRSGGRPLCRPNDIVLAPDGRLYFTDPGRWDPDARPDAGVIHVLRPGGSARPVLDTGPVYPNGLGFDATGRLVWVESYTRRVMALSGDGRAETLHTFEDPRCVPDGLCVLPSGRLVIALTAAGALGVLSPDGCARLVRAGSVPTNCALAGAWLYVTDGGAVRTPGGTQAGGSLWRIRSEGL